MTIGIKIIVILLCTPLIILTIHAVSVRILNSPAQTVALKSAFSGYFFTALLLWQFVFRYFNNNFLILSASAYCFIVYTAFAYTYFHFFNMSETARRIRILYEIHHAGALPFAELEAFYKTSDIVNFRLKRLVAIKRLKYTDGFYSMSGKILYWAALFIKLWRNVLGFNKGQV